jgi:hypothetical protein
MPPGSCRLRVPAPCAEPDEVGNPTSGGSNLSDPGIPCEWCGMVSSPGAICEVCGSPLPHVVTMAINPELGSPKPEGTRPIGSPSSLVQMGEELASLASSGMTEPESPPRPDRAEVPAPSSDLGSAPMPVESRAAKSLTTADDGVCSRCGQPSENQLCDACREAFHQLQELSLGLDDDKA